MMNVLFCLNYHARNEKAGEGMTADQWDRLRPLLSGSAVPETLEEFRKGHSWNEFTGDLAQIVKVIPANWVELKEATLGVTSFQTILAKLDEILSQGHRIPPFNEKVRVVVPGVGLLAVERVEVLRDQCTDTLQNYLDQGWRILAICPQPDQRRPDYVMGHTDRRAEI